MLSDRCMSETLVYCVQTVGRIKMKLGMQVGLGTGHIVFDGDTQLPSPKKGAGPQFSAHVYCAQTARWIKMPLDMEVGHDPRDIVLHGDPAPPPQKGGTAPNFRPMFVVPKLLDGSRCYLVR